MDFIKEESEDIGIEVKLEDTEEQTDQTALKQETEGLSENDEQDENQKFPFGKSVNQSGKLDVPVTHSGKKTFTCRECGKGFTLKGNLNKHMRIHTGEKPFSCGQCGKSFTRKQNFERHVTIHNGEKEYTCQLCGDSFTQQGNFTVHMKIHTGENPYTSSLWKKQ